MDSVSIKRAATLHPKISSKIGGVLVDCEKAGCSIRITRATATLDEQNILYQAYLKGGAKAAPPGLSYHNYGLAIDFCLLHKDGTVSFSMTEDMNLDKLSDWSEVVKIFESYGFKWGASFGDNDHMEQGFGYTVQQLQQMVKDKKVDSKGFVVI